MSILCRFGWHDWTKWGKLVSTDILATKNKVPVGVQYIQSRSCNRCDKSQVISTVIKVGEDHG